MPGDLDPTFFPWVPVNARESRPPLRPDAGVLVLLPVFYLAGGALGLGLFLLALHWGVLASVGILFYQGLAVLGLTTPLHAGMLGAGLVLLGRWSGRRFSGAHVVGVTMAALGANLAFFTIVPVTIDRSVSIFLLGWMAEHRAEPQTPGDLGRAFSEVYVGRFGAIDRRVREQLASGTIEPAGADGGYRLTAQGRTFVASMTRLARFLNISTCYLAPGEQAAACAAPAADAGKRAP